jgi:hypothetical protein
MLVKDVFTSPAGTVYSTKGSLRGRVAFALMYFWTGTLAATATLWASNLDDPTTADDTDWVQVTDVTLTNPTSGGGKFGVTVGNAHFRWYRVKFAGPSGAGVLTVYIEHRATATS